LKLRAQNLIEGIRTLLASPNDGLAKDVYDHPLIKSLSKREIGPSYIPSRTFALALLDVISPAELSGPRSVTDLKTAIGKLPNDHLKRALTVLLEEAQQDIANFEEAVEIWFNNTMERVSGIINLVLALVVTVLANADSILIVKALSSEPALRATLVAEAERFAEHNTAESIGPQASPADSEAAKKRAAEAQKKLKRYRDQIQQLGVPIGWTSAVTSPLDPPDPRSVPDDLLGWLKKIIGLLLTAVAVSLGAPFWFDLLNKFTNIRSAGKAPEEKQKSPKQTQTPPEPGETPREASGREESGGGSK
jgi:hypothetical protein